MRKFAEDRERYCRQQSLLESKLLEKEAAMESWRKERDALVAALEVQLQKLLSSQAEKDKVIKELSEQSSKQPAEIMYAYPVLRKTPQGRLLMGPTEEANRSTVVVAGRARRKEEVLAEAAAFVRQNGGDPGDQFLVLAHCKIQFGKHQNQRFRWLLENSLGYAV
ncbi:kinesin-like protein KIF20B [Fundulus heteroclitus]|uniref:kinesin-like protein KIF20B n=1 Tax=Fundulus heteroclitus TaxID=8078 RepID=UPI00165C628E|nr:kinesin-like protein KIF20B [Fundulus heteroclitus]